ncbi:MAG: NnrS family protein [Rhodoferax sp.]
MTPGRPSDEVLAALDRHWRARYLLLAPHRLGFFLAMVVLIGSGAWWALVQMDRVSVSVALPYVLSPTLVHAAVMTFGFTPLFFSGFLFTAVPKWLRVEPIEAPILLMPLLMQACGWLLWVTGIHVHMFMALAGLALAWSGLARITWLFWRLVWRSQETDRLHARTIGWACLVGCISLGGLLANLVVGATAVALASVLTGLWGFVVVVFLTVAHRMIPFFTSSAMPFINAWRPFWALGLMLTAAVFEGGAVWVEIDGPLHGPMAPVWMLARGTFELLAGGILLWLAQVWGLMQSLKNRLLTMLHIGFLWLGLALVLGGVAQLLGLLQDTPVLSLGSLHALTMGCLSSLMLAMVTRVSCGHSGRAQVADRIVWTLFWLVQLTTLLRITAAAQSGWASWLLLPTAVLWAGTMGVWGVRLANWYGRLRPDGRPG